MIKFKNIFAKITLTALACLSLSACSSKKSPTSSNFSLSQKTVALITDNSGIDDNSFNESAWQGIKQYAHTHNLNQGSSGYDLLSADSNDEIPTLVDKASDSSFNTIFGVGSNLQKPILKAAKNYPNKNYVLINSSAPCLKNTATINFNTKQGAYLAGVVAAEMTKTKKIGFIGGLHTRSVTQFEKGFKEGIKNTAKKYHKNIQILTQYTNTFSNATKGQEIAENMYNKKVDIIFHAAGKAGKGVFKAARQINQANPVSQKVWVIGVDRNQSDLGKYQAKGGQEANFTLTSVVSRIDVAVNDLASQIYKQGFPNKKTIKYDLSNDGVYIVHNPDIPTRIWIASQKAKQEIIDHKIKI
ncbi:BMP family lipoprotein [Lactobacillus hominis]|uniref:Lipoprotein A-antigen n=1 Tax=Lactobacillus hominis DSM 23910 = CRBIP 24.179 TaxID=1423758 RepID=I7KHV5_9LACO|nr:BMP family ABC transporter substrate-binding protein [Lactobacillus hominis]KRM84883.1 ABC superfamily ATP binding cassette transporter, binding protein [Lactobacillus hominis DSM 23910 = CRBIP 24.179]MCT3348041.1 BMP family ABC transporter substrate-binding protein [Lactobacillus hominis]CCI82435.1 Lipoprotein A-antigen [Lactobacillus hominis DSM 23910 = CRBIP 24.179]